MTREKICRVQKEEHGDNATMRLGRWPQDVMLRPPG